MLRLRWGGHRGPCWRPLQRQVEDGNWYKLQRDDHDKVPTGENHTVLWFVAFDHRYAGQCGASPGRTECRPWQSWPCLSYFFLAGELSDDAAHTNQQTCMVSKARSCVVKTTNFFADILAPETLFRRNSVIPWMIWCVPSYSWAISALKPPKQTDQPKSSGGKGSLQTLVWPVWSLLSSFEGVWLISCA